MSIMEIIRYNASMAAQWDEFARHSRNGTFMHQRNYMDYHSDRFTDCSLVAMRDGKPCAMLRRRTRPYNPVCPARAALPGARFPRK